MKSAEGPWTDHYGALTYLATATIRELDVLARAAALMLESGDWWGIHSTCGWVAKLMNESDVLWHLAATDFIRRYDRDQPVLSEALIWFGSEDLARELAYHRGWCPHKPRDKHYADERNNPVALTGEPELLLLECDCFSEVREAHKRSAVSTAPEARELSICDHPEYGPSGDPYLSRAIVHGDEIGLVSHEVFVRWSWNG